MTEERENELTKKFLLSENESVEELKNIEIQEIIFLIYSAKYFKDKKNLPNVDFDNKFQVFHKTLRERVKTAEELYIAYDKNTGYPYVDVQGRTWIFSKKEYADNAEDYFLQQMVMLEMKKINKEEVIREFADFHRLGIEKILLDNGKYTTEINRDDVLPPPDWSSTPKISIPITNPNLQFAMLRFFQAMYSKNNYAGKTQELHRLEDKMLDEVITAKYLIPMHLKEKEKTTPNADGVKTLKSGTIMQFANLVDKNDKSWLPAFTDWVEFQKVYDKAVWSGNIATYDDLLALSKGMEGIAVNCNGTCLRINENNKAMIEKYKKEKDNNDEVTAVKQNVIKKDTKVMLGEPKDYPSGMIEAVKEHMKKNKCIKAAYLRLMLKDDEKSYLIVVDFRGEKNQVFQGIAKAASPYLKGMYLDMVGANESFGKNAVKDVKPFYKRRILGIF
ncbi:enhanced serine sensitivity protein SseB [Clostridium neuense]|uniref:Enhanced serine sensitivity protein SseB n=1 Tax=Clostridium neuense TaxID=1728934 RepID=A0ABW8TM61_9CLOT